MFDARQKQGGKPSPRLNDPGALVYRTVRLPGGERVRLRVARPTDAELVHDFIERLVGTSSELRHVVGAIDVNGRFAHELLHFDPRQRMLVCATTWSGGSDHLLGLGEVAFRGRRAEARLTVDTAWRKRGVGTALIDALAYFAGQRGAQELAAEATPDMQALLARLGEPFECSETGRSLVCVALPTVVKAA